MSVLCPAATHPGSGLQPSRCHYSQWCAHCSLWELELVCSGLSSGSYWVFPLPPWFQLQSSALAPLWGLALSLTLVVQALCPDRSSFALVFNHLQNGKSPLLLPASISDPTLSSLPLKKPLIVPLSPVFGSLFIYPNLLCVCNCDTHTRICSYCQEPHGLGGKDRQPGTAQWSDSSARVQSTMWWECLAN